MTYVAKAALFCDHCGKRVDVEPASHPIELHGNRNSVVRGTMRHPAKRAPSGGESRVRLGAGLGNEVMQTETN